MLVRSIGRRTGLPATTSSFSFSLAESLAVWRKHSTPSSCIRMLPAWQLNTPRASPSTRVSRVSRSWMLLNSRVRRFSDSVRADSVLRSSSLFSLSSSSRDFSSRISRSWFRESCGTQPSVVAALRTK